MNKQDIAEKEWGQGNTIVFGGFDSCMGIVGIKQDDPTQIWGVHLVQTNDNNDFIPNADWTLITQFILSARIYDILAVGNLDSWSETYEGQTVSVYETFMQNLKIFGSHRVNGFFANPTYEVTINKNANNWVITGNNDTQNILFNPI